MRLAVMLAVIACCWGGRAGAHAILVDSDPAVHGSLAAGHATMRLRFNSRIDRERSRLTLIGVDRSPVRLPVGDDGAADTMTSAADLVPGDYTVRWQVLAVDGHITRGDVPFTVTDPAKADAH